MPQNIDARTLSRLSDAQRAAFFEKLSSDELESLLTFWPFWARPDQLIPEGDWIYWLPLAGRGWGKTRTGAETVRQWARNFPLVNLIGATADDVRDVMVEGESGVLALCPRDERPRYVAHKRRLDWPNGAKSLLFSAEEPERLRGKQHMKLWCLIGDSLVAMADGSATPIRDVRAGDMVRTRFGCRRVIASCLTRRNAELFKIEVLGGKVLLATAEHPVWIEGCGFLPMADIQAGMRACVIAAREATRASVASHAPWLSTQTIVSVEKLADQADVYDLAIEGAREFFAEGILVHNCDELAAWRYPEAWDQAVFGLRLGAKPQAIVTTTPRPTKLMRELLADPLTHSTQHSTFENIGNLAENFLQRVVRKYEGTRLGRQELHAHLLLDAPGALWTREIIEAAHSPRDETPQLTRIVVAVDPPATSGENADECGMVVAGLAADRRVHVLADLSRQGETPLGWATRAVQALKDFAADCIVAEVNNGGEMIETLIRQVDANVPYRAVRASRGKFLRAEPVAALYEQGRVRHCGTFAKLEDQMCLMTPDFDRARAGYSPDRVDALVWAIFALAFEQEEGGGVFEYYRTMAAKTDGEAF